MPLWMSLFGQLWTQRKQSLHTLSRESTISFKSSPLFSYTLWTQSFLTQRAHLRQPSSHAITPERVTDGNLLGADSVWIWYFAGMVTPYTSGLGSSPPFSTSSGTTSSHSIAMMWTPWTPFISFRAWMVSTAILIPSWRCSLGGAPFIREMISSGMSMPATLSLMYSAILTDLRGVIPPRIKTFVSRPLSRTCVMNSENLERL